MSNLKNWEARMLTADQIKQQPEGKEVYGMLKEAYRKEMSRTWKERHAKGVPVRHKLIANAPEKWILSETESDQFGPILIASLVNFRYKQSWLEKGGKNG